MMKSEEKNEMVKMMMGLCESERKIKQQYDQLVKCNSAKGLTLAQVGEFANCLIEAKNELQLNLLLEIFMGLNGGLSIYSEEASAYYGLEYICILEKTCSWRCFCVLEGENGDLRVGVRRLARHQSTMPTSVISSQSMHLGVLATASHDVSTKTLFVVFYKPR
ncbi:hypothetical protein AALP_AA6G341400 [Arabis alpina]|uniref:Uncharacterized protein n=1 Tax=Arabis alpina TaxID=50452 RepID=A0A087GTI4_ARAAL|nr:hypothetical protein AALP_AA6G341400 [Arabis alpina]